MSNPDSKQKGPIQRKEHKSPKVQEGIPKYTENDTQDDMKQGTTNINKCILPLAACILFLMALAAGSVIIIKFIVY